MSTEIEQRIVQMQFDNADFEKRIAKSMKSLEEFDKSLDLKNTGKAFEQIEAAANKVTLSGLQNSIEKVKDKFTTLEMVGFSVINRLVNKFADAGERMVKSLSIDQITQGWDKYAEKTSSVQTIMAATADQFDDTAEQMKYVNDQLEKLNWYTDETSYNFLDMVNNIGKFTSNNVPLDKAVTAMQGIANWAAISGANANQASHAMYNLSQAISLGYVQRLDWKSIESMNMATAQFKETAAETAVELGKLKKVGNGMYQTLTGKQYKLNQLFTDGLQARWLDNDALLTTIDRYGQFTNMLYEAYNILGKGDVFTTSEILDMVEQYKTDASVLMKVQDQIGINSEDLTKIFDKLIDKGNELGLSSFRAGQEAKTFAEAINATKEAVSTGWMKTFEIIFGDYEEAKKLWTGLANNLYNIFAGGLVERNNMLAGWKELGGRDLLFGTEEKVGLVTKAFENLSSIVSVVRDAFRDLFPKVTSQGLYDFTKRIYDLIDAFELSEEAANTLRVAVKALLLPVKAILTVLKLGAMVISGLAVVVFRLVDSFLATLSSAGPLPSLLEKIFGKDRYTKAATMFSSVLSKIQGGFKSLVDSLKNGKQFNGEIPLLTSILSCIKAFPKKIFGAIGSVVSSIFYGERKIESSVTNISGSNMFDTVVTFLENGAKSISQALLKVVNAFTGIRFENLLDVLHTGLGIILVKRVTDIIKSLNLVSTTISAIGILLYKRVTDLIGNISKVVNSFSKVLTSVSNAINAFSKVLTAEAFKRSAQGVLLLATAIGVLAVSLKLISSIESEKLVISILSLGAIMAVFAAFTKQMKKILADIKIKTILSFVAGVSALAISIGILSLVVKSLSKLSWDELIVGLAGLGGIMTILSLTVGKISNGMSSMKRIGLSLVSLSVSIIILSKAVKSLSALRFDDLVKGLVGVGALLAGLALFSKFSNASNVGIRASLGLIALSGAINILASVVLKLSSLSLNELLVGLGGLTVILGEVALVTNLIDNKSMISIGAGLILFAAGISMLAKTMITISSIQIDKLITGLVGLGVILAEITLALKLMPSNVLAIGAGLLFVAGAMSIISKAVVFIGGSDSNQLARSLIGFGGALLILAAGLNLMKGTLGGSAALMVAAIAISVMTPALMLLGTMSLESVGKSLLILAGAITVFGVAAAVLTPIIPALLGLSVSILALGAAVLAVGAGVSLFAAGIALLGTLVSGTSGVLDGFIQAFPKLKEVLVIIIEALAELIVTYLEKFVSAIPPAVARCLAALAECTPSIISAAADLIVAFLDGLSERLPDIIHSAVNLILVFSRALMSELPTIINTGFELMVGFLDGLGQALEENIPKLIGSFVKLAGSIIKGLVNGLGDGFVEIGRVVKNLANKVIDKFKEILGINSSSKNADSSTFKDIAGQIITGLINGFKEKIKNIGSSVADVATSVIDKFKDVLGIHSPSTVARDEVGVWIVRGIAEGIKKDATAEEIAAEKAKVIIEAFQSEFDKADWAKTAISGNYDIWAALAEDQASEDTKALKEYQKNKELMNEVLNEVSLAAGEVAAQKALGASAEEIEKANEKYLSAIKEFTSLAKELNEYENREYDRAEQEGKIVKKWTEAELLAARTTYYDTVKEKMELWADIERMGGQTVQQAKENLAMSLGMDADLRQIVDTRTRKTILETANQYGTELFGSITGENFYQDYLDTVVANVDNIGIEFAKETGKAGSNAASSMLDSFGDGLAVGLDDKEGFLSGIGGSLVNLITGGMDNEKFKGSAAYLLEGLINGIDNGLGFIGEKGEDVIKWLLGGVNKEAEINSPSKKMEEAGGYLIQGIINGLDSDNSGLEEAGKNVVITINNAVYAQMDSVYDTGKSAGERLIDGVIASINNRKTSIANTVGSVLSAAVSIPVRSEGGVGTIGLTPVRVSGTGSSSGTVNPTATLSPITTSRMASEVLSLGLGPRKFETQQTASGKSITFIQNNTSPKALSTAEIYRQTNNIIAAGKEAIKE